MQCGDRQFMGSALREAKGCAKVRAAGKDATIGRAFNTTFCFELFLEVE